MAIAASAGINNAATGTSTTLALNSTVMAAGDRILVFARWRSIAITASVSDGVNTYNQVGSYFDDGVDRMAVFEAINVAAGTRNVTITFSLTVTFRYAATIKVSGSDSSAAQAVAMLTNKAGTWSTAANNVSSGNMTPTSQPIAFIGPAMTIYNARAIAAGTGYTSLGALANWDAANGDTSRLEWLRATSTSAAAVTFTLSGGTDGGFVWGVVVGEAVAGHTAAAADTNTPTDSAVSITTRLSVGTDTNTPTDSAVSITTRLSVAADTNTPSDSAVSITTRLSVAADTNTPTDSAEAATGFPAEATDTNTPTDSAVALTTRVSDAADTNTPSDSAVSISARLSVGEDTNTPTDSAEAGAQLPSVASDTNTPTDSAVATNVPAGVSFGVDTNTPSDSAVSITARTAMGEDFNTPSDSAICIGPGSGAAYFIEGTAFDEFGRMVTEYIAPGDPLPQPVKYLCGVAHDSDGARYVTTWPGASLVRYIDGFALRMGGVQIIVPEGAAAYGIHGLPVTARGELCATLDNPRQAVCGVGISARRVSMTDIGP